MLMIFNFSTQAQHEIYEYKHGAYKVFECDGKKSHGLKFRFNYPENWDVVEPNHPNFSCKIINDSTGSLQILVIVKEFPHKPDVNQLRFLQSKEAVIENLQGQIEESGDEFIVEDNHKIDGENAVFAHYLSTGKRLNYEVDASVFAYYIPYEKYQIVFAASATSVDKTSTIKYNQYLPLFKLMACSFVILNKWEK
jgi:hypothetical protein